MEHAQFLNFFLKKDKITAKRNASSLTLLAIDIHAPDFWKLFFFHLRFSFFKRKII